MPVRRASRLPPPAVERLRFNGIAAFDALLFELKGSVLHL
jgi:hypothetical protein